MVAPSYIVFDGVVLVLNDIVKQYTTYVREKYGTSTIVFDGYLQGPSTKDHEHIRCSKNMTANVQLRGSMIAHGPQQSFLSNERNKSQFIPLLMGALRVDGHSIYQAKNDADTLIVARALNLCCNYLTVVVSDDTDVLVLMVHHFHEDMRELYFFSEASARSKEAVCNTSISAAKENLGHHLSNRLLFAHTWSGCDATSAIFGQGKSVIIKQLRKCEDVQEIADVFLQDENSQANVESAGIKLLIKMYLGREGDTLNELRYAGYMNTLASSQLSIGSETLPPTESAARFHCRCRYKCKHGSTLHQIQHWRKNGGGKEKGHLEPIMTDREPAPPDLLNVIRCKCKLSRCSSISCSCRKYGLHCVSACLHCRGENCENVSELIPVIEAENVDNGDVDWEASDMFVV